MAISRESEIEEQVDPEGCLRALVRTPAYGASTILVVDDEPVVRAFTSEVLGLEGYMVLEAPGTAEGLRIASEHPGRIDLIISDVVLPDGDDGRDLVERLRRMRPTIKSLYISGYAEADIVGDDLMSTAFLQKPFTMDMLVEKVREVLDAAEARIAHV